MNFKNDMKGLDIAKECFFDWCLPEVLSRHYPKLFERVAACVLWGSQALGNDDPLSVDHEWGPTFELVLTNEDYDNFGFALQQRLDELGKTDYKGYTLPAGSKNFRPHKSPRGDNILDAKVNVMSLKKMMFSLFKDSYPIKGLVSWKYINESYLYFARHGAVFYDPLQALTEELKSYRFYPESVRRKRIVDELNNFSMYGSYNYPERVLNRNDPVRIITAKSGLINAAMTAMMLLNKDFAPYWKWLHTEFLKQPGIADMAMDITLLTGTEDPEMQRYLVHKLEGHLRRRLLEEGYTDVPDETHLNVIIDQMRAGIVEELKD